MTDKHACGSLK